MSLSAMPLRPHKPKYADLHGLSEDQRIEIIGRKCLEDCATVAVCVDDEPGKAARYVRKIHDRFPAIRCIDVMNGPTKGVVTIKLAPR